ESEAFLISLPGIDMNELMKLAGDPSALTEKGPDILAAFEKRGEDSTRVDLDKDWHALHFLLTGNSSMDIEHRPNDQLHNIVMGGHETSLAASYGPARSFTNKEVTAMARELEKISVDDLRSRFSAAAFNEEEIYPRPRPGGWDERQIESVFHIYPK